MVHSGKIATHSLLSFTRTLQLTQYQDAATIWMLPSSAGRKQKDMVKCNTHRSPATQETREESSLWEGSIGVCLVLIAMKRPIANSRVNQKRQASRSQQYQPSEIVFITRIAGHLPRRALT